MAARRPSRAKRKGGSWWDAEHRQAISFFVGIGLGVYEVMLRSSQRPYVLAFIAALIGAPVIGLIDRLPLPRQKNDE